MAKKPIEITAHKHADATRRNIPTAEYESVMRERVEAVTEEADLEEVYETERHLLYVACTRARDRLSISGVAPASEFLRDVAR
jgi:ATP-dependent exoDNAse (exonuclease V) beta subunit